MERDFGTIAFLSIPTWAALAAIPLGFALIGIRLTWKGVVKLVQFSRGTIESSSNPETP
jgi:hypothetical protein